MKRHISAQKFYEEAIMKTYDYRLGDQVEKEMEEIGSLPDSFSELMLKRALHGFRDNIPKKHPFDELGFSYICQLLGMSVQTDDYEFMCHLFDFMNAHTKYFDFNSQDQFDACYEFYYETLTSNREFNQKIGTFILKHFSHTLEGFDKVVTLAYNLNACDFDMSLTELVNLKREKEGLEPIEDFHNSVHNIIKGEK